MCMEEFTGGKCDERIAAVCDPSCEMGLCVVSLEDYIATSALVDVYIATLSDLPWNLCNSQAL